MKTSVMFHRNAYQPQAAHHVLNEQKAYRTIWLVQMEAEKKAAEEAEKAAEEAEEAAEEVEEAAAISSYRKQTKTTAEPVEKPAADASSSEPSKADKVCFLSVLCLVPYTHTSIS